MPEVHESAALDEEAARAARDSDADWNAAKDRSTPADARARKPRWGMWVASLTLGTCLASAGWLSSDDLIQENSEQHIADHWMEFRSCLLGARLPHGVRPNAQAHFIELATFDQPQHADWPARCVPYAESLDEAMQKPDVKDRFVDTPQAAALLRSNELSKHGDALNQLYDALNAANLPVSQSARKVPVAPTAVKPLFDKSALISLGHIASLDTVQAQSDATLGESLRLLVTETPARLCSFNDSKVASERWRSIACSPAPKQLKGTSGLRLSRFAAGAPSLLQVRDAANGNAVSFYDATTGQRLWRSRAHHAEAATTQSGAAVVVETSARKPNGELKRRPKLVRLTPGKRPNKRTLRLKRHANTMLFPDALVWWQSDDSDGIALDAVGGQRLHAKKKLRGQPLARLPHRSQIVSDCAGAFGNALLSHNDTQPPRYTLLFHRGGREGVTVDAGIIDAKVTMACHDRSVTLLRERGEQVNLSRCSRARCSELGRTRIDTRGLFALGSIDDQLISITTGADQPVRLQMATPANFGSSEPQVLLDKAQYAAMQVVDMRVISGERLAIVLLQAADGHTYGLRINARKQVQPLLVEP